MPEQQATQATEADGKWEARSIEQIKKDVEGKKEYTIVWGDTLSGISLATNVTMEKLASLNGIGDYNLIYAGNKLVFEGNVVTVQDQNGVVTDQQQITESDKIVPNQPIGESVGQVSPTPNMSNTQDQTNVESSDTASIPSSNGENKNDGTTGNGSSSDGTNNGGVVTNPTPTPTPPDPDPAPTPTPEPEVHYTVWFYAYEGDDQSRNIEKGSRLFSTEEEATTFIDGYADSLLMEGIAGSYGVMSWE
ncbi:MULTISPECIES: LysM peptidoglycan-binding domain-containing protein [Enterococcus]|uniref:LysM peptidoglycan-binding domain-containing protein n=1 Tax=Enterococcus TaxID=1350 RepID=UPI001FCBD78D|nr:MULTISPECIES: LysM domain-containing protein [Enterococcus]